MASLNSSNARRMEASVRFLPMVATQQVEVVCLQTSRLPNRRRAPEVPILPTRSIPRDSRMSLEDHWASVPGLLLAFTQRLLPECGSSHQAADSH